MNKKRLKFRKEEDYVVYQNNERMRVKINAKLNYDECIKEGRCYKCFNLIEEINVKTEKKYHACKECRVKHDMLAKLRS